MAHSRAKVALIAGVTGQDGAYLTELLLSNRLLKNWGKGRRVCLWRRIGIFGVWQLAFGAGLKSLKPPLRSTVAA